MIPAEQVIGNNQYRPEMQGVKVARDIYAHVAGIDIVRAGAGEFYVLEDNLRVPSGVSYMLENRKMMMRLFPDLFARNRVAPVAHYPDLLLDTLRAAAPDGVDDPTIVVLTPGMYNSAYFEHAFLAQQMGVELVEGQDLFVEAGHVYMRTTQGPQRIDVIYRRLDDDFLDPDVFRADSTLGVAGLISAYRAGNVTLANAVGTGVADDKSIYPYVPDMVRFYLGEEPILNNVPTWMCRKPDDLRYVLDHLPELVVKETHGAGGYGMLVGPASSSAEIEAFRAALVAQPGKYIAQPTLALSTCPTSAAALLPRRAIDLPLVALGSAEGVAIDRLRGLLGLGSGVRSGRVASDTGRSSPYTHTPARSARPPAGRQGAVSVAVGRAIGRAVGHTLSSHQIQLLRVPGAERRGIRIAVGRGAAEQRVFLTSAARVVVGGARWRARVGVPDAGRLLGSKRSGREQR